MGRRRGAVARIREKWKRQKRRYLFKRSMINRCPICYHPLFWVKKVNNKDLLISWKVFCPKCGLKFETVTPYYYTEYEVYNEILSSIK